MPNFTESGPDLLPLGDIDQLAMPSKGLSILEGQAWETAIFSDAGPHDLAIVEVFPGRSTAIEIRVTAHDDAGSRMATAVGDLAFISYGAGAFAFEQVAVFGSYDDGVNPVPLGAAPWNTLTATAVQIDATHAAVRVTNGTIVGVPIRWSVWIGTFGAQAR